MAGTTFRTLLVAAAAVMIVAVCASGAAAAPPARSPLPGYPRFRGVMLVHNGSSASVARERDITSAIGQAGSITPRCPNGKAAGANLCFWGGPVVGAHKVHLIFWEGETAQAHPISNPYREAIERYFGDVAKSSGAESNVYAVQSQYAGANVKGEYQVAFGGSASDVYIDKNPLPSSGSTKGECIDNATPNGFCITDKDLQGQVELARTAENVQGHKWEASLHDVYFVFTPPQIGSCFYGAGEAASEPNACAFEAGGYCAYHSAFENAGKELEPPLYASIPDGGEVEGCDSFEHPNGAEGVDATIDTVSHEHNETISDPFGDGWLDVIGQEVGDKCLPPETFDIYGVALGGFLGDPTFTKPGVAFNQEIGNGKYWLQREWSNAAGLFGGGCVQHPLDVKIAISASRQATIPMALDGSGSGGPGDPAAYWVWDFLGTEEQIGTTSPTIPHTFMQPGIYEVGLTAYDAYGNSQAAVGRFEVAAAPPALPASAPLVIKEVLTPVRLTAAQVATRLGLPANGKKLSGNGPFSLGRAECPPACGITLQLFAKKTTTANKHTTTKLVLIGSARFKLTAKGAHMLSLSLNAKGKQLLHKLHKLSCKLVVSVEGQEGGSWQITRSLALKG
ncbi:MAG: PKD domain-containing protein [Solirubrobacteraceae bacterium]